MFDMTVIELTSKPYHAGTLIFISDIWKKITFRDLMFLNCTLHLVLKSLMTPFSQEQLCNIDLSLEYETF